MLPTLKIISPTGISLNSVTLDKKVVIAISAGHSNPFPTQACFTSSFHIKQSVYDSYLPSAAAGFTLVEILAVTRHYRRPQRHGHPGLYRASPTGRKTRKRRISSESLNRAVLNFNQANWDIPTAANNAATTDEFIVLRSLQYKWPTGAGPLKPGSPYFNAQYNPTTSSDTTKHRIRWNGRTFDLLRPGTRGIRARFLKPFDGSDRTVAEHIFPTGYKPAGMLSGTP